jgi:uncharacterized protein YggE
MAQTAKASQSRLRPPPKVLEKALKDSADRARRMAEAFGLKVPEVAEKPVRAPGLSAVLRRAEKA